MQNLVDHGGLPGDRRQLLPQFRRRITRLLDFLGGAQPSARSEAAEHIRKAIGAYDVAGDRYADRRYQSAQRN